MLQKSSPQQYELEVVTMEQLVPQDHLVCKIDSANDFEFIRDDVALLYCKDNGRPTVDLVAEFLERRGILGVFGYRRPSRTKNAFKKKHFIYRKEKDSYR